MAAANAMYLAFGYVAKQKQIEPYYYGELQQASKGAWAPPEERLERLHRGIQLPLGLGWKLHHLLHTPSPLYTL